MLKRAVLAGVVMVAACGPAEKVEIGQPPETPEQKTVTGRGERLVGVLGAEQGGCPWSADTDSQGRVVTLARSADQSQLHAFSLEEGPLFSKVLPRPFTVVKNMLGTNQVQVAHWWEDSATGAYGWRSAYLSPQGEVLAEEEKGRDPFDRHGMRSDGALLVMPHGGHYLEFQKDLTTKPAQFFNARDLGYTMWQARLVDDARVLTVGISVHPIETPAGLVGSEGRFVALVMADDKGKVVWAKDLSVALPPDSEIDLGLELGDDAAFVTGGNTWNNNDKRIHVESFLAGFDFAGAELFKQTFENADAPWLVTARNHARVIVPKKSPSNDWYQRAMEHVVINRFGKLLHSKAVRGEGPHGIVLKRLMKANGIPVAVGCFYGTTQFGEHTLSGNGDSGFVFMLDPRIEE